MIWRFRRELLLLLFIYFSLLINKFYYSKNFTNTETITKKTVNYFELIEENKRLRRILDLKETNHLHEFIVAKVINFVPYLFPAELVVDKGKKDGIKEEMVVITENLYLVGKVEKSREHISYISTVFNSKIKISAIISSTGELGIVEGGSAPLISLKYISSDSNVKIGDEVITSGHSKYFPPGLKIGRVIKIVKQKNSLFLLIYIKPYCLYSSLKEVLIGGKETD